MTITLRRFAAALGAVTIALTALTLTSCQPQSEVRFFAADAYPEQLSRWGLLSGDAALQPSPQTFAYTLNTPLFSDYAKKLRTIFVPNGTAMQWHASDAFSFPPGSVITKTFYFETAQGVAIMEPAGNTLVDGRRLLETRLLVRQQDGWDALVYIWDGDDAFLHRTGRILRLTTDRGPLTYLVPSGNQCASCHATDHDSGAIAPIGPRARHLNTAGLTTKANQLGTMIETRVLAGAPDEAEWPRNAAAHDPTEPLQERALAYLDINCGHCHSPTGPADTSGLWLDAPSTTRVFEPGLDVGLASSGARDLGVCKPPIASGRGSGGRLYGIVPGNPSESILSFRMATTSPATMMPELGRSVVHQEGVDLVDRWIASLSGTCR